MKKTISILGYVIPALLILFFAFGFLLAPHDPYHVDMSIRFQPPGSGYPLGTDNMGRCVLSRLLYGGRTTLAIILGGSLLVAFFGCIAGLLLGGTTGQKTVWLESLFNAVTAIPPIAYLIIFISAWGNGVRTMLSAVTVSLLLRLLKLVKSRTETELAKAYIMCALASGADHYRILFFHIFPNLIRDVMNFICMSAADMVLSIVGFSFIGLGLGDNVIDWGTMVSETHHYIIAYPGLTMYPVAFIFLCTLSLYLLGHQISLGGNPYA
jgi:ABC-type dipeptide/oligopeptide/nickel transport systems, permease components